jgi:uncharacterized protein YegP (UPF0339 family)
MYYETYQSGGEWRWRLKGRNHEILAEGESYKNKADCRHVIDLLKSTTNDTPVKEV